MDRNDVYARMVARIAELPPASLDHPRLPLMVILPHHDLCRPFSELLADAYRDFGFSVDRVSARRVSGEEFHVIITPISALSGRGLSLGCVWAPQHEGLTNSQVHTLKFIIEYISSAVAEIKEY